MAQESEDDSSKTEDPSQKKLEEARNKGQIVSTRELYHFAMLLAMLAMVISLGPTMGQEGFVMMAPLITAPESIEIDSGGATQLLHEISFGMIWLLVIPFLLTFIAALAPAFIQRKWVFSTEHIQPKLSKISPLSGFGRLLGLKAIIEFLKNMLKLFLVVVITTAVALPYRDELALLMRATDHMVMVDYSEKIAVKVLLAVAILLFFLSIGDYLYQRFIMMKSLRMSKQELKDEYKQAEGDPHIKMKLKQIRRERARTRMMANVPKADVVITNPTHFAVALAYDPAKMQAPLVLAKGADDVAARIREVATQHKIPVLRNPPLARVLYDTTDIDDEIPMEHYQAVAKIIGYVYRLKGKTIDTPAKPGSKPGKNTPGAGKKKP
jgi:flagellar biosynthetic protein FlhB